MNFKTFSFVVISTVLLATKEIESSKKKAPDMTHIGKRFADLLNSLVKVNTERVDALKKLFKLYDVKGVKHLLRASEDEENSKSDEVIVFHNTDKYPEIIKPIGLVLNNNRLCTCRDKVSDNKLYNNAYFDEQSKSQEIAYSDENLHFLNDDPETDRVIFQSIDKQSSNERNNPTSDSISQEQFSKPIKGVLRNFRKSRPCITPRRGYEDCKSACKEAYGTVCAKYGCGEYLHHKLRKHCRKTCRSRFIDDSEDDDYDYYDYIYYDY